jgi:hypothetical protein
VNRGTKGLEHIERVNQYYVNKKLNATGNVDVDKNLE